MPCQASEATKRTIRHPAGNGNSTSRPFPFQSNAVTVTQALDDHALTADQMLAQPSPGRGACPSISAEMPRPKRSRRKPRRGCAGVVSVSDRSCSDMAHKGNDKCKGKTAWRFVESWGGYEQGRPSDLVFNARVLRSGTWISARTPRSHPPSGDGRRLISSDIHFLFTVIKHVDDKRFATFKTV